MRRSHGIIDGYEAPIHRAIWERVCTMGAPRMWATLSGR